ncbi:sulfite exporter TauE/SafE family protein [Colwellia sp. MB02u-18]|nr:sulfite exporter TauE/SafE family protein [Colwellia sp. MB3u-45]MBA6268903.1 sulfite exporter TauE/SafE family protein [Colwellia sp. MB3u-43]MBA6321334.1 sulfite exporter TauE/SafE family protein [Colwellia sp. MB02u-19]MBA6325887.1 sulfite exporter TauE/SafE family protein [Colwellia sp. MB02u-18]MBA6332362.1 sulfite exporter TauE/SafE family protein [Colwellia sp. MB02u-12]MBA6345539.1 sulfite exporter TauE/SafE family protein [Colwellia sp. MB02u-1]
MLIIFVAILIGLSLGLLGSGGSILTVPALTYIVGQDEKTAIASSLAIVGIIAFSGAVKFQQNKMIHWPVVLQFGLPSMLFSYLAAGLSIYFSGSEQLSLFAVIMLLAAFSMLKGKANANAPDKTLSDNVVLKLVFIGAIVGSITGLVGVGGGFLIVPALLAFTRMNMVYAVATSLAIITLQSLTGFIKYFSMSTQIDLKLNWQVIVIFALIGSVSSLFGQKIATNVPQEKLKKFFAIFLLIMSVSILIHSISDFF